jgi:DNA-binding transcriptional MerR regulator
MKNTPTFNLKAVMQMTGLSADTLRAWERRYHLPVPERTPGGQRIYSQRDIDILQWLMDRQSEGISISNAVSMWNNLTQSGSDPLGTERSSNPDFAATISSSGMEPSLNRLRAEWLEACLAFNENQADQVINRAFAITSPERVCNQIFMQGLFETGERWYRGAVSVQQEHFAAGVTLRRLGNLISSTPPASRKETILICCPPGEEHSISSAYLSFLLKRQGYKVIELGAKTPIAQLKETVLEIRPRLVVLSAQQLVNAVQLKRTAQVLAKHVPVGFGGRIFKTSPSLIKSIPGIYLGDTLEAAPGMIENIINNSPDIPLDELENPYQNLHELFELKLQTIYSLISILNTTWDSSEGYLSAATHFINNAISAALYFGDLDLLLPELVWIEGFLINRQYRRDQFVDLCNRYTESIHKVLGQQADPIINCFGLYLSRQEMPVENKQILSQ